MLELDYQGFYGARGIAPYFVFAWPVILFRIEKDYFIEVKKMDIKYIDNILTAEDFRKLNDKVGGDYTTQEQAERAVANQLFSVVAALNGEYIGMARLIGDGAIYWCIVDVFVLPQHQGKGFGRAMVERLIRYVYETGLPKTSGSLFLMCAKGKEGFYEKLGFVKRPHSREGAGMEMEIEIK